MTPFSRTKILAPSVLLKCVYLILQGTGYAASQLIVRGKDMEETRFITERQAIQIVGCGEELDRLLDKVGRGKGETAVLYNGTWFGTATIGGELRYYLRGHFVSDILRALQIGENRLLHAQRVGSGRIP